MKIHMLSIASLFFIITQCMDDTYNQQIIEAIVIDDEKKFHDALAHNADIKKYMYAEYFKKSFASSQEKVPHAVSWFKEATVHQREDLYFFTPLLFAVIAGKNSWVETLLDHGAKIDCLGIKRRNLIHFAIKHNPQVIEILVQHGALVNHADHEGNLPVHDACLPEIPDEHLSFLLAYEPTLNITGGILGLTPLQIAVNNGSYCKVKTLLNAKADPNFSDENGWTALHWLVLNKKLHLLDLLMKHGADITARTKENRTVLNFVTPFSFNGIKMDDSHLVRDLLFYGAPFDKHDTEHKKAIKEYNEECMYFGQPTAKKLILAFIKEDEPTINNIFSTASSEELSSLCDFKTPFMWAVARNNKQAVDKFIAIYQSTRHHILLRNISAYVPLANSYIRRPFTIYQKDMHGLTALDVAKRLPTQDMHQKLLPYFTENNNNNN